MDPTLTNVDPTLPFPTLGSSAFVFSPSKSNRSGPMRISRAASAFAAVVDVHRSSNPVERGDEVLTRGADARLLRYLLEKRNCTHLRADDDVIAGLTGRHVAMAATCWRILHVRSVGVWPGRLPCPRRDQAPTVRRRLCPHHLQPPRRACSPCAAFF